MSATVSSLLTFAYDSITIAASSTRLTLANVRATPPAQRVLITVETAQIRWRVDGTAPTASEGHLQNPTDVITLENRNDIENFRAIRTGATSATLRVSYQR